MTLSLAGIGCGRAADHNSARDICPTLPAFICKAETYSLAEFQCSPLGAAYEDDWGHLGKELTGLFGLFGNAVI